MKKMQSKYKHERPESKAHEKAEGKKKLGCKK